MQAKRLVSLVAFSAVLGGFAACGGSTPPPGSPSPPPNPTVFTFSGTVRSGGTGLGSVQVVLSGDASRNAVTDNQGAFSFAGVSGNSFVVTPSFEGFLFTPSKYDLGPSSRAGLDFTAAKQGPVYGYEVGDTPQDFTGLDQSGQTVSLYSYRGKVILIDISADWCVSCRAQAPKLEALYQQYKDQGFQAITILTSGSAADWASALKVTHPVIADTSRSISNPYAAAFLPLNVILDRTMVIRWKSLQDWEYEFDEAETLAVIKLYL